jgi:cytochrome c biogenesis protein CcmG/thiol:disulfide interchange protein DsbE
MIRQIARTGLLAVLACAMTAGCDRGMLSDQIGRVAPVFSVSDGQHAVDWASWCAPCVAEMPSLEALKQEMPQVQIVAIASDEDFAQYQNYVSQNHIDLLTVFDEKQVSNKLYGSFGFPETYIIDKQGVIRRKLIGPQDFTSPSFLSYLNKLAS